MSWRQGRGAADGRRDYGRGYRDLDYRGDPGAPHYDRGHGGSSSRAPPPPPRRSVSPEHRYDRSDDRRHPSYADRRYGDSRGRGDRYHDDERHADRYTPREYREEYRRNDPPPPRDDRGGDRGRGERRDRYADRAARPSDSPPRQRQGERSNGNEEVKETAATNGEEEAEAGEVDEEADAEDEMMKAMGFGGFGSTKGTKVRGNQAGLAEVKKERTWRQYMQRKGGFNRPLSPVRK